MKVFSLALSWLTVVGLLQGCSTWETVPIDQARNQITPGDTVRVTRVDGFQASFLIVKPVADGTLHGSEHSVALKGVAKLEKRAVDSKKSDEDIGVGVTIVVAIIAIIVAGSATAFSW